MKSRWSETDLVRRFMRATLRKTSDLPRTPSKNGLGTTREVARGGGGPATAVASS